MDYRGETVRTITTTIVFCIYETDCEGETDGPCVGWSYHRSGAALIAEAESDLAIIRETDALLIQKEDGTEDIWILLKPTPITAAQVKVCIDDARMKLIERAERKLTAGELAAMQGTELDVGDADPEEDEEHPER